MAMMGRGTLLAFCGLLGGFVCWVNLQEAVVDGLPTSLVLPAHPVEIWVSERDVPAGQRLQVDDLVVRMVDPRLLPRTAIRRIEGLIGRSAASDILAFEPVRAERLVPVEAGSGAQASVPAGYQAVSVAAPHARSWVSPGDQIVLRVADSGEVGFVGGILAVAAVTDDHVLVSVPHAELNALVRWLDRVELSVLPADAGGAS